MKHHMNDLCRNLSFTFPSRSCNRNTLTRFKQIVVHDNIMYLILKNAVEAFPTDLEKYKLNLH